MKNIDVKRMVLIAVMACMPLMVSSQLTKVSSGSVTLIQHFKDMIEGRGLVESAVQAARTKNYNFVFEGYIVGSAGDNKYEFKDDSGTGLVKIINFRGLKAGPGDRVRLMGGAAYDNGVLYLEVVQIKKGN